MKRIKRYPNRKLYDTDAKRYITLEGIADLIRRGEEVQVINHQSGQDLTAVTLTQVIAEMQKSRQGFLPQTLLTGLVRAGGETMTTLRQTLASSLDLARQVDEEIEQRLQALISRGELAAEEGRRLGQQLLKLRSGSSPPGSASHKQLEQILQHQNLPSRQDVERLADQLDALLQKLDERL